MSRINCQIEKKGPGKNSLLWNAIVFELFASAYVIVVVLFLWERPVPAVLALAFGVGLQLFFWKERLDATVMAIAALLGAPSEVICVKSGLWSYHAPGLVYGVPIWIPLVWAYLICLFRRISLTSGDTIHIIFPGPGHTVHSFLFSFLQAVITAYFLATVLMIAKKIAIAFTIVMLITIIYRHSHQDILLFIVGAILGTFGEYICMQLGFWHYHYPRFAAIGLPMSLPLAWGLSSVIIVSLAEKLRNSWKHFP